MIETEVTLRVWGNSIGLVLPMEGVKQEHLGAGNRVKVTVERMETPLREAFGKLKSKEPTDELMKIIRRDLGSKYVK